MFAERKRFKIEQYGLASLAAMVTAAGIAGCGGQNEASSSATEQVPAQTESDTNASSGSARSKKPRLVFDALGGGSPVIEVYAGPSRAPKDKESVGGYPAGESVVAECKTEGRVVKTDPSAGEEDRSSADWVRIEGGGYATAAYIAKPEELLPQLPEC